MGPDSSTTDRIAQEIAREIASVHEDSYGRPASNLQVAIHEGFVAVIAEVELTPAEAALARAGNTEAVRTTRESFAEAIGAVYEAIVERATGRRVASFASRLALSGERPWSAELLQDAAEAALGRQVFAAMSTINSEPDLVVSACSLR
jgi:uncharacterized protein YbcI